MRLTKIAILTFLLSCVFNQVVHAEREQSTPNSYGPQLKNPSGDKFWLTLDVGADFWKGVYPSIGLSMPVPFISSLYLSVGLWSGVNTCSPCTSADYNWGPYVSVGRSWTLID